MFKNKLAYKDQKLQIFEQLQLSYELVKSFNLKIL